MAKKKPRTTETQLRKDANVRKSSHGKYLTSGAMMEAGAKNKNYKSVEDMKQKAVIKGQRKKSQMEKFPREQD